MATYRIIGPKEPIRAEINITGSKSISNRVLLIRSLSNQDFAITNLSESDDTKTLDKLISQDGLEFDAHHAGTTFRFLTAYFSILRSYTKVKIQVSP